MTISLTYYNSDIPYLISWFIYFVVEDTFVGLHLLLPTYILDNETRNGFKVTQNWTAADSFLEKEDMTRMQKIEALEMAAAIILTEPYYRSEIERAFGYWRRALYLRQMEPDLTQKTPLVLKSGQPGEWITSHQLEGILAHPSEYQIQSFLVRLRTCSSKSWGAVLSFLNDSFDECIYDLKMQGRLVDLLDVLWVTLETIQNHLFDYESDYENCLLVEKVICNLIWMLSQLNMDDPLLNAETFTLPLQVMVAADEEFAITDDDSDATENSNSYIQHVEPLYKLIVLLAGLPRKILTPQIRQSLRQLALGEYGTSLLHMACKDCNLPTIRLLLESKADPNAEDRNENVALHILADHYGDDEAIARAAQLLLERGAQLEIAIDRYGRTPADVWIQRHQYNPEQGFNLPAWCRKPVTALNLKDLCTRVIRLQDIPYDKLPVALISLIEMRD